MTISAVFTIKYPKLLILLIAYISISSNVYAQNACDVNLKTGLRISESKIEFFKSKHIDQVFYSIDHNNNLFVRGKKTPLNAKQKILVKQYNQKFRAMVPRVRALALDSVDLAINGVNESFNELLGKGNKVGADLTKELVSLRKEVVDRFTIENSITIGAEGLEDDQLLGAEIEQRIKTAVQKTIINSMGSIMVTLGQEIMLSGGNLQSLEKRITQFSNDIENKIDSGVETIERKANTLCDAAIVLDQHEEKLKSSVEALSSINVITAKKV